MVCWVRNLLRVVCMKTLANGIDQVEIVDRLRSVNADDVAGWGIMNAPEMLCHLRGAFRVAMGELPSALVNVPMPRELLKSKALWEPTPWQKNFYTVPVLKLGTATMQVGVFEEDKADVLAEIERFQRPEQVRVDHSLFGEMSYVDWMRWGYVHTDHHLRQFRR
jgi:hypothetical protein